MTLLPVFYAHGGFGGQAPNEGQRRFLNDLDSFARLRDHAARALGALPTPVLGLAPIRCARQRPRTCAASKRWQGKTRSISTSPSRSAKSTTVSPSGARPVEWLLANAPVDARWCLVHATHMMEQETRALAATGAVAGLCPITEANLGDGLFPAETLPEPMAAGAWAAIPTS
jgi:cytosine/adenosine deaminase-related metal-dependent hydrolase